MSNNEPMRILHIVPNMQSGGIENFIMNIYREIDREKVQFDFLVHYKKSFFFDDEIKKLGGRIYRLSFREDRNIFKYIRDLDDFFSQHKEYSVVHGHMSSLGFMYLKAAEKYNVKVRIAHSHNSSTEKNIKGFVKSFLIKGFDKHANKRFACSNIAGEFMFGKNNFDIIRNAIDIDKYTFDNNIREEMRRNLGINNKFVIGHVGRFCKQKNHEFLIDVFNNVHKLNKDAVLVLIGAGELEQKIREKIKKLNLSSSVLMLGVRKDVNKLYQAMDAFVFPSVFEGLGMVAVEAQAAGLMCFCSDTIPREADITRYFNYISLKESHEKWAEIILSKARSYERKNTKKEIDMAGYDIKKVTEELCNYYLQYK